MPQFSAFGRKWFFSSDELPFIGLWGCLFHLVGVLLLGLAAGFPVPPNCTDAEQVHYFIGCLLGSFIASVVINAMFIFLGLRGSIFETRKRYGIHRIFYLQVANFCVKVGLTAYGTSLILPDMPSCIHQNLVYERIVKGVVISTWVIVILYILMFILTFNVGSDLDSLATWERRARVLNCCCCGRLGQDKDTLAQTAWVFADFFRPIDFSPLDTVVAMILTAHRQRFKRMTAAATARDIKRKKAWSRPLECQKTLSDLSEEHVSQTVNGIQVKLSVSNADGQELEIEQAPQEVQHDCTNDEKIQIVVETDKDKIDNAPRECEMYQNDNLESTSAERTRRQRNLALDLSAFDICNEVELEDGASMPSICNPVRNMPNNEENDNPSCVLQSGSGMAGSSSAVRLDSLREGGTVLTEMGQVGICQTSSRFSQSTEFVYEGVEKCSGSFNSEKTTLTWGDSFSGPFLTPPGGAEALGISTGQVPLDVLKNIHKYHRYANAIYGTLIYLASSENLASLQRRICCLCLRATPPNRLRRSLLYRGSAQRPPSLLLRDVSLTDRLDNQAILGWGVQENDIIHRHYENSIAGSLPYFVALDREAGALVISVRGTSSLADLMTDFLVHPEPLTDTELQEIELLDQTQQGSGRTHRVEKRVSVHKGILGAARALVNDLEACQVLDLLDTRKPSDYHVMEDVFGWDLVLTGHSLGAGVASLAALLLRKRFNCVKCYAISPPGGIVSPELASAMAPFCTSFLHGKDMIPRLGVGASERLRDQMVLSTTQCKKNKTQVLLGALAKKKWTEDNLFHPPDEVSSEAHATYQHYKSIVSRSLENDTLGLARTFVAPGRIVFLRPWKPQGQTQTSPRQFKAIWTSGQELAKEGILMSAHMFKDHFPFHSIDSLQTLIETRMNEVDEA